MDGMFNRAQRVRRRARCGWSAFELAVVVFVLGDLLLLLAPWLESSSESARATSCAENLRRLGGGAIEHASVHRFFPSSGWGFAWLGDPDRGFGAKQPGGWMYSILPFIGQSDLWRLGAGIDFDRAPAKKESAFIRQITTPIAMFYCPARRETGLYPYKGKKIPGNLTLLDLQSGVVKSDYAINVGAVDNGQKPFNQFGDGPTSYGIGDGKGYKWPDTSMLNGISFLRSEIRPDEVTDGLDQSYLIGEKYLDPRHYTNGRDRGDSEAAMCGFDVGTSRVGGGAEYLPRQDASGSLSISIWGSAHADGVHFVFCDGSVHTISYQIDPETHRRLANRHDGEKIDHGDLQKLFGEANSD